MSAHEQTTNTSFDLKGPALREAPNGEDPDAIEADKPPSLRTPPSMTAPTMSSTSSPLGPINAARRPGPPPPRASNLTTDIQKRMKEMMLSRQGPNQNARPGMPGSQPPSSTNLKTTGLPGGAPPNGMPGRPPSLGSPVAGTPRTMSPRGPMGGLAAKRGLKAGGMKLSDAQKPPAEGETNNQQDTGSQFGKYANIVDTKQGTLTFKDKAVVHGSGIDFSNGTTFSISLDEVDTIEELGKGNYGTVF